VYLVLGWVSGTFGGLLIGGAAFFSGLADDARPHALAWLVVGVSLLVLGVAAAVPVAAGSRTSLGRALALAAAGGTVLMTLWAVVQ
jgi:hypothetical protein